MTFYPSSLNVWGFNCSFMFRTCRCLQKGATNELVVCYGQSTAFLDSIRYYLPAAPFFQPVGWPQGKGSFVLFLGVTKIHQIFFEKLPPLRLSILWPTGPVQNFACWELVVATVATEPLVVTTGFGGENNLSVFGEMSMKWKKFWKKFGSKYARLLFLKAPAGNNLQGAFSARRKKGEEVPHLDAPRYFFFC